MRQYTYCPCSSLRVGRIIGSTLQQWESIAGATAAGALGRNKDVTECLTDCSVKQNLSGFSRSVVPRVCSVDPFGSTSSSLEIHGYNL